MRFADTVLSKTVQFPPAGLLADTSPQQRRDALAAHNRYLQQVLGMVPLVGMDNVYRYVKSPEFDASVPTLYDLPSIAPPFSGLWADWTQANGKPVGVLASVEDGPFDVAGLPAWGETHDNGLRWLKRPKSDHISAAISLLPGHRYSRWLSDNMTIEAWHRVRWLWGLEFYQGDGRDLAVGPISSVMVATDERGQMLDVVHVSHVPDSPTPLPWVVTFLQGIAFMHCRNVALTKITPPAALSKKHRKKGRLDRDLVEYHVIEIDPLGPRSGSRSARTHATPRLHIARGSFHHYGDCCPGRHEPKGLLFGKQEGIFWVPQHIRGSKDKGVVVSDYRIKKP